MKKLIAVILSLVLIISCLPLTATAAKDTSIEAKFRLLLEDMELDPAVHQPDRYVYSEVAQYPVQDPDWVLISAFLTDLSGEQSADDHRWATLGNKLVRANRNCAPFSFGFGVYDVKKNAFYDLIDAWEMDFAGLRDVWNDLPADVNRDADGGIVQLIGDANGDGNVSILDATRIQRIIAKLDADPGPSLTKEDFSYGWPIAGVCDYDRDGKVTVLDATSIQRRLVSLPKTLEFTTLCCSPTDPFNASPSEPSSVRILRTSAEEFDFTNRYGDETYDLTLFHDDPSFHEKSVLVGAFVRLPDESCRVKSIDRVSLGADGVLTVDLTYEKGSEESSDWMILLGITRAFADDIRNINLNITREPGRSISFDTATAGWKNITYVGFHIWSDDDAGFTGYEWGTRNQRGADPDGDGVWTYDLDEHGLTLDPDRQYAVIFYTDYGARTYNLLFDTTCIGDTAYADPSQLTEAPEDSNRTAMPAYWRHQDPAVNGPELAISTLGNVIGSCCPRGKTPVGLLKDFLRTNYTNAVLYSGQSAQQIIDNVGEGLGLTAEEVEAAIIETGVKTDWRYVLSTLPKSALTAVIASITSERPNVPDDLNADGYRALATEPLGISYPEHYSSYEYPYPDSLQEPAYVGDGYLMLLRSRSDLEYYLPEINTEGKLDDAFFGEYAVLAALMLNDRAYSSAQLSDVAVHNGTTLYADPWIKSNNQSAFHDDDMMYDLVDEVLLVLTKVKQSDVKDVDTLACWKKAEPSDSSMTASVVDAYRMIDRPAHPQNEGYTPILSANSYGGEYYTAGGDFPAIFTEMVDDDTEDGGVLAVVRSAEVLPKFFNSQSMVEEYDDAYFEENALVILVLMLDGYDYGFGISHICVKDGVLYAEYDVADEGVYEPLFDVYYAVSEVRQSDVADVKQTALWKKAADPPAAVVTAIPRMSQVPEIPDDPAAEGYAEISAEPITMSAPQYDYQGEYWNELIPDPEMNGIDGYVLLLRSRADLLRCLPGFDDEGTYNDAYFKDHAIVAMIGQGTEYHDTAEIGRIAVKDNTLYAQAYIQSHIQAVEGDEDAPVAEPIAPVVWTFRQVSQSDVAGVTAACCWSSPYPAIGRAITNARVIETYDVTTGLLVNEPAAQFITEADEAGPAIGVLYMDENGEPAARDDHVFTVENWKDSAFNDRSVIALRVYVDDLQKETVTVDRILRSSRTELTVELSHFIPKDHDPDEGVRFLFISIPNYGKSFTVKVNEAYIAQDDVTFSIVDNYFIQSGELNENNAGYHITASSQVRSTLDSLYEGYYGEQLEPDGHRFGIEGWIDSDYFSSGSVIAMRVFQGSSSCRLTVDRVYRSGADELTVDVSRHFPSKGAFDPDMCWRLITLSIPQMDRQCRIRINSAFVEDEYNGFKYFVHEDEKTGKKTVEITDYTGTQTEFMIPDSIYGDTVTAVGYEAFADNGSIRNIYIPDTVTDIGTYAFRGCANLSRVSIPERVRGIEEGTFAGCPKLEQVSFYSSFGDMKFTHVGSNAFSGCTSLKSINLPATVTSIGRNAFKGCPLTDITLPMRIERIDDFAFGFDMNNDKIEGFSIYGYRNTAAEQYAVDNGFAFVALDGTGDLNYSVIDCRYPSADMRFLKDLVSIYVTSPDELAAALDTLYLDVEGVSRRADDPAAYAAEALDEEWFRTHDLIAVRIEKNRGYSIWINGIIADVGNKILVSLIHDYNGSDPDFEIDPNLDNDLCFLMLGIDKRDLTEGDPEITVNVGYYPEPLKPIIYLYPEQETELTVTLGKPEELTCTYPAYNGGWHITAKPDGTLIGESGRSYYALYWESKSKTAVSMTDGFVVRGEDTASFLEEKLAILGLSEREAQEFIVYWLPQMQDNTYNFIRFATAPEIEAIMPLSFSVQPDTVIRVLMEYKPLEEYIEVPEQTLATPERRGFVAVEWGGTLIG